MDILRFFDLTLIQLAAIMVVAILVGMGKAGLSGTVIIAIPILAAVIGGRPSTGLMLLMFISADVFAVKAYHQGARWDQIRRLLPAAVIGIVLGGLTGRLINDQQFKYLIAALVVICLALLIYQEIKGSVFSIPQDPRLAMGIGIISGFASMVGNAAGPIFAVYMLALGFKKQHYLGTTALFFFILNLIKLPVQVFVWRSVTWHSVLLVLMVLPLVYAGIRFGLWAVKHLHEKTFRYLVSAMTLIAAVRLFF